MRCVVRLAASLCLVGIAAVGPAADPRPSWECLPEDTAFMLRMPQPAGFLEALRTRTKFGAVALSERRLEGIWKLALDAARADGTPDDEDLETSLAKYGLSTADLTAAFRGDMGLGSVIRTREGGLPPLVTGLAWLEPGEEAALRMVEATRRKVDEDIADDETGTTRRIDLDLAGHEVLWMVEPVMGIDPASQITGDGTDEEAVERRLAELQRRVREAKLVKTGHVHAFLARLGGRLLVGQTLPAGAGTAKPAAGDRDFDAESGGDIARDIFERFLAAHAAADAAPLADALAAPGMAATLPAGVPLLDVVVDPRVLMRTLADEETRRRMAAVGVGDLGPIAWRQALDEDRLRSGLFVSLPAPRTALMRILDQPCDGSDVPPFVTRDAVDFTQVSLDLGRAYETVKEFVVAEGGPESANLFTAVEMQAQGWLGVNLPTLLSSLGSRHWLVNYPPRVAEAVAAARRARNAEGGAAPRQFADAMAVVWRVADEGPFGRILQRLAAAAGGELQEEQGFRGVRLPDGPAVFLGQDHLVVGVGADSLEKTLAAIRNPPAGDSSFRDSNVPGRAGELLPMEPARMVGLSDSSRTGGTLGILREMLKSLGPEDVSEPYRDMLAAAQKLLPGDDEMEGMFGIGATTLRSDDAGIALQTAWEMPAP